MICAVNEFEYWKYQSGIVWEPIDINNKCVLCILKPSPVFTMETMSITSRFKRAFQFSIAILSCAIAFYRSAKGLTIRNQKHLQSRTISVPLPPAILVWTSWPQHFSSKWHGRHTVIAGSVQLDTGPASINTPSPSPSPNQPNPTNQPDYGKLIAPSTI